MTYDIEPGTVIHGTLRNQDLYPVFLDILKGFGIGWNDDEGLTGAGPHDDIWDTEYATVAVLELMDELDSIASTVGMRFGAHEGDGSDFGFWEFEDEED